MATSLHTVTMICSCSCTSRVSVDSCCVISTWEQDSCDLLSSISSALLTLTSTWSQDWRICVDDKTVAQQLLVMIFLTLLVMIFLTLETIFLVDVYYSQQSQTWSPCSR